MRDYFYRLIGDQINRVAKYSTESCQVDPLEHDDSLLFSKLVSQQTEKRDLNAIPEHNETDRTVFLVNGNLNYNLDCQQLLRDLRKKSTRHTRIAIIAYNPYLRWVYRVANALKIRQGPFPLCFLTKSDIHNLATISGFEVIQFKSVGFLPFRLFGLGDLINRVLSETPIVRNLSFASVIWLRPVGDEPREYSLSIIVPARNEAGNIARLFEQLPEIAAKEIEIIFVEGNSSDDTWEKIQDAVELHQHRYKMVALQQPGRGKFDAVRFGFHHATMDLVTILDADLTMPPEMISRFLEAYTEGHAEFINGNRLVYPMELAAMRTLNFLGNRFFAKFIAYLLNIKVGDTLCGTKLLHRLDYERQCSWREDFGDFDPFGDFELLFAAAEFKLGVVDVPVRYRSRTYGETQIERFRNGLELIRMCLIGLRRIKFR